MNYSLTYTGVIVLLLSGLAKYAGLTLGDDQITSFVLVGAQFIGALVALIGRYRAGGVSVLGRKV
jgi:hypothetical protein